MMGEIIVLEIEYAFGDNVGTIYPVVLLDNEDMVLVDCGYSGFLPLIEEAFERKGLNIKKLTKVVVTHHDYDHMGALNTLKQKYPNIEIIASYTEAPFIRGDKKALRLEQAERIQETLSDEQKAFGQAFCEMLRGVEACPVDIQVNGGDEFNWCGGCQIIDSKGHTAGHISLYLKEHKIIVTGDAGVLEKEKLVVANPQYAFDLKAAENSLRELLSYDASTYICYHGGIYRKN